MKESIERDLAVADALGKMADARIKELEGERDKWKRRALAFQEGYRDKSFEVTALEIQKMDLLAHGADKVVMRQNESLKTKLLAACIERNEARDEIKALRTLANAAMRLVLDPDNQDAYHDSFHSNSAAWPPEFLHLADAVLEHCAHTYQHENRDTTEDPNGYCTVPGCEQPLEHWIHLGTIERAEFLGDKAKRVSTNG